MRYNLKLEIITPVHIGSGQKFMNGFEFFYEKRKDEFWGGIIDVEKIYEIIGEKNIQQWTSLIEKKENVFKFVKTFKQGITLEDICKRTFPIFSEIDNSLLDVKEQLHTNQKALLPGSSLKGAIRTAILTYLIKKYPFYAKKLITNYNQKKQSYNWNLYDYQVLSKEIENKYFSNAQNSRDTQNKDIFRFLGVSDAIFDEQSTISFTSDILNLYQKGWDFKPTKQLVECIGQDENASISITIKEQEIEANLKNNQITVEKEIKQELIENFSDISNLFTIINEHTKLLIDREIKFWTSELDKAASIVDSIEGYIENLKQISEEIGKSKNSCITRVGGNEGWDFITGAWANTEFAIFNKDDWKKLYLQLNKGRQVSIYPKTRKIDLGGELMGFVKISKSN